MKATKKTNKKVSKKTNSRSRKTVKKPSAKEREAMLMAEIRRLKVELIRERKAHRAIRSTRVSFKMVVHASKNAMRRTVSSVHNFAERVVNTLEAVERVVNSREARELRVVAHAAIVSAWK